MLRVLTTALAPGRSRVTVCALAMLTLAPAAFSQATKKPAAAPAPAVPAATLDRIRTTGTLKAGYRTDARPYSYRDESGNAAGYSVDLCRHLAESIKGDLGLTALKVDWVPVTVENRFGVVQKGEIDVLCGAETVTLERRKQVAFSIPVFPGGVGVLLRSDAPARLKEALSGRQVYRPNWRGNALQVLREQTFAVVGGTTAAQWLSQRGAELQLQVKVTPVDGYAAGVQAVADRRANAFFGDRAILLDAARRRAAGQNLMVADRLFTYEPVALTVAKGDDDFRLLVDRTLSRLYASAEFAPMYTKYFGEPDEAALTFYRWNALPN